MIIDRFEGDMAIITDDDGPVFSLPVRLLPVGSKEGDLLTISIKKDIDGTEKKKRNSEELLSNFFDG